MKIAAALFVLVIAAAGALGQPSAPLITTLDNGLTVILQEDHSSELVGLDVYVKAGSAKETQKSSGTSHFIEHLLFATTKTRKAGDMDREMESLGATLDAHTNYDYAHFNTTVSSRYLPKALDIFFDAINNSEFREQDIARERLVILDEIARSYGVPENVCRQLLAKLIYGEHPYALPIEGTRASVKDITRNDILDFYHRYYVPANIAIVLVGDIDTKNALELVKKAFQCKPTSAITASSKPIIAKITQQLVFSKKYSFDTNYLAIGYLGPLASDYEDVCAADVLLTHIGLGYRSWLSDYLKNNKMLIFDGKADCLTQPEPSLITIMVSASTTNIVQVKDAIFAMIEDIKKDGLSQADIDRAKRSLLGEFAFQVETVSGRANNYGFYFAVSDPSFASKYTDCVQSITNEDIKKVALKYLNPSAAAVVTVGPDMEDSK